MVSIFWKDTNFTVANLIEVYDQIEALIEEEELDTSKISTQAQELMKKVGISTPLVYFIGLPLVFSILAIICCIPICCPVCCCTPGVRFRHLQKKIDKKATKYLRSKRARPENGMRPHQQAAPYYHDPKS